MYDYDCINASRVVLAGSIYRQMIELQLYHGEYMPRFLLLIRHGDYDDESLTCEGAAQVGALAQVMKPLITHPVCVYSSPALRTRETATIIADSPNTVNMASWNILADVGVEYDGDLLYSDEQLYEEVDKTECNAASLILVAHEPVCYTFFSYYMNRRFNNNRVHVSLGCAEAVIIDCQTGDYQVVRYPYGQDDVYVYESSNQIQ